MGIWRTFSVYFKFLKKLIFFFGNHILIKEKEIILKDKKPHYKVDDFGGILYYQADNNSIFAYDLKK